MAALIKALERVCADADHIHLLTPSSCGREFDEKISGEAKRAISSIADQVDDDLADRPAVS